MNNKINEEELEKLSNQQSIKARLLSDIGAVEAQNTSYCTLLRKL